MDNLERRQTEMLIRVDNFGKENAADFPAESVGGKAFKTVSEAVEKLNELGTIRSSAADTKLSGTAQRRMAREELYQDLMAISATARALALDKAEYTDKFRMPRSNLNDRTMLETARAFASDAASLKADFQSYGLPEDFLEDLNADIANFEKAAEHQDAAHRERTGANASIEDIIEDAMIARRKLQVVVPNTYRGNSGKLADWASASHVERPARKQTETDKKPQ